MVDVGVGGGGRAVRDAHLSRKVRGEDGTPGVLRAVFDYLPGAGLVGAGVVGSAGGAGAT